MPKIRQAIAVVVAAAFCIGFNTFRYPAVRAMVAAIAPLAQPAGADPTDKASASHKGRHDVAPGDTTTVKLSGGVRCKDGVCTTAWPEPPSASLRGCPETGTGTLRLVPDRGRTYNVREPVPVSGQPLSSAAPDDGVEQTSEKTDEMPASPDESVNGSDFEFKKVSEEAASKFGPNDQGEPSAEDGAANPERNDPAAESAAQDASAKYDPYSAPAGGSGEETPGGRLTAKLVSAFGMSGASSANREPSPAAQSPLVPIKRPNARSKEKTKGRATATDRPASDFMLARGQEPPGQNVRRLPPVDPLSGADTPDLAPGLVRTYPVTSAR